MVGQWQFYAMYVHDSKEEHCLLQTYFPQKNVPIYPKKELQEQVFPLSGNFILCCHECCFLKKNLFSYLLLMVSICVLSLYMAEF